MQVVRFDFIKAFTSQQTQVKVLDDTAPALRIRAVRAPAFPRTLSVDVADAWDKDFRRKIRCINFKVAGW